MTGIAVSNAPNTSPTRSRVRPSTPLTPMPTDAARLDSPSDAATSSSATMPVTVPGHGQRLILKEYGVIITAGDAVAIGRRAG